LILKNNDVIKNKKNDNENITENNGVIPPKVEGLVAKVTSPCDQGEKYFFF